MLVSMNWIRDFVNLDGLDIEDLIKKFTLSAAEVEEIHYKGREVEGVIAAKIVSVADHPNSKKLHLLKVDAGSGETDVVCGAKNVRPGMMTAFAPAGSRLPGMSIGEAEIAGCKSYGMCCSEAELGISADASGIMELDDATAPGSPIKDLFAIDDICFEVDNKSLTNRPDLWGHYGIAREFAAIADRPLNPAKTVDFQQYSSLPPVEIEIKDKENALRYTAVKAENITRKTSPVNMRIRLNYCGLRAINLLADLTNYVMLEQGQPMHAFDLAKVDKITVQRFEKPFKFVTLDGIERDIDPETLMICRENEPVAIAGIMGGEQSQIGEETDSLLLESATFDAVSVRKSSTRLGLRTDSSMRYEKSLDPELAEKSSARFLQLLLEIDPSARITSRFSDSYVKRFPEIKIDLTQKYIDKYTGIDIKPEKIMRTLTALGFGVTHSNGSYAVTVPSHRATKDVTIAADIIEEITRIYGYDNFTAKTTKSPLAPVMISESKRCERGIKNLLSGKYLYHEVHSHIWNDGKKLKKLGISVPENVTILNIASPENNTLRNSLIPTLLCFAADNKGYSDRFGIYEIGSVFEGVGENGSCNERKKLGMLLLDRSGEKKAFFDLLNAVSELVITLKNIKPEFESANAACEWQHKKNTCNIRVGDKCIGFVSAVHPANASKIDKNAGVVTAQIDIAALSEIERTERRFVEPSKYPGIEIDLSFIISRENTYADLESAWKKNPSPLLVSVRPIDFYEGETRSVTVRLSYSSSERTLTMEDIQPHIDTLTATLARSGIELKKA